MTRQRLVCLVEKCAKGDFSQIDLRRKDLDDCYQTYSVEKSRAYWNDINEFAKVAKEFDNFSNDVYKHVCIPSFNRMMFTLFQCVYFWKNDKLYAAYRYDTNVNIISGYFVCNKFKTLVEFEGYDFETFKKIYLNERN